MVGIAIAVAREERTTAVSFILLGDEIERIVTIMNVYKGCCELESRSLTLGS